MLFGLSLAPMMALVGGSVQYSRANQAGAIVQEAVDAAVLVAAGASTSARNATATAMINANMANAGLTFTVTEPATVASSDTSYTASVTAQVPTLFLSSLIPNISITRSATATIGSASTTTTTTSSAIAPLDLVIVADVGVMGVASGGAIVEILAVVVAKRKIADSDLLTWLSQRSPEAVADRVVFADSIPRTDNGKIKRSELERLWGKAGTA